MEKFSFENNSNINNSFNVVELAENGAAWVEGFKNKEDSIAKATSIYFNLIGNNSPSEIEKDRVVNHLKARNPLNINGFVVSINDNNNILIKSLNAKGPNYDMDTIRRVIN